MERRRFGGRGDRGGFGGGRREGGFVGSRGGFGGGRRDFDRPKPVKIGEEHDVEITDVGAKGDGITRIENFAIFVSNGKKGEKCRIKIKEVANKFAIAEKVSASPEESEEPEIHEESKLQE